MLFQVRLYSNNHASCVGVGEVQDDETSAEILRRWRPQSRPRQGQPTRVVVKVSEMLVPSAFTPHKGAPPASSVEPRRVTMKDVFEGEGGRLVLWDIAHVRLVADWKAPLPVRAPSASANGSAAYDDDAEFFASPVPDHVVGAPGKTSLHFLLSHGT